MAKGKWTIEQIECQISDLADFEEVCDPARARAIVTWINRWFLHPESSSNEGSSMSFNFAAVERIKERAEAFADANQNNGSQTGGVSFLSVNPGFPGTRRGYGW